MAASALIGRRRAPRHVRSDNSPELIAKAIGGWLEKETVEVLYIATGAPWENVYAESFHSRLRDELLNAEEFASQMEARALARDWQDEYNHERPNSSLGSLTPSAFAKDATVSINPTLAATGT